MKTSCLVWTRYRGSRGRFQYKVEVEGKGIFRTYNTITLEPGEPRLFALPESLSNLWRPYRDCWHATLLARRGGPLEGKFRLVTMLGAFLRGPKILHLCQFDPHRQILGVGQPPH